MRRITSFPVLALATGLVLTGCTANSGQDTSTTTSATPSESASPSTTPETYELGQTFTTTTSYGAEITVKIPAEGPAEVEQLRQELGIDPISYAKVGIDNRDGTEDVSVYVVTVYDEDGTAYEFGDLSVDHIGDWGPEYTDALGGVDGEYGYTLKDGTVLDEGTGADFNDRSTTLYNHYLNGTNASKLEVSTGWLATTDTELPERVTGITVQPNGMSEEEPMTPGGTMPSAKPEPSRAPGSTAPADDSQSGSEPTQPSMPGAIPNQNFTYEEAYAAWENGMPYYDAFCIHYEPTTDGGRSQCEGIEAGTVDSITGEYIGG